MHKEKRSPARTRSCMAALPGFPPAEPRHHQGFVLVLGLFLSSVTELGPWISSPLLLVACGEAGNLWTFPRYPVALPHIIVSSHSPFFITVAPKGFFLLFCPTGAVHMGGNNQCPVPGCPAIPHQESGTGAGRVLLRGAGESASEAPGSTTCPPRQSLMRGLCPETGRK